MNGGAGRDGAGRDVVVIAASAGGVEALRALLQFFPADLPATILVVLHVPAAGGTALPMILDRAGQLSASAAVDGEPMHPGHVYVAPPDHHLLVIGGTIRLSKGPRHQGHRPAADPLFFSAALTAGSRTIAVVLSGTLSDGAAGAIAVEDRGGVVLVQDPAESAYDGMPKAAIAATRHPIVLPLREIAARIVAQSRNPAHGPRAVPSPAQTPGAAQAPGWESSPGLERQLGIFLDPDHFPDPAQLLKPAAPAAPGPAARGSVTCPECARPLNQENDQSLQFVCPAGHTWSAESLMEAQAAVIVRALWAAVFRLEERARLCRVLADATETQGPPISAKGFRSTAVTSHDATVIILKLLSGATGHASQGRITAAKPDRAPTDPAALIYPAAWDRVHPAGWPAQSRLELVVMDNADPEFDELLLMLKETRGFDFIGYKRSTLMRRVRRRMDARGLVSISEYRDYLELEPDEFLRLFDSLLINVTGFFRDPPAWQALRGTVLPELLSAKGPSRPIRVWSAGCATGEEAYTLAIVLAEELGTEAFTNRVKIYATDLDENALQVARAGVYTERQIAGVEDDLRQNYLEPTGSKYTFRRDLRRQIIFGHNDLTHDAPISRVDLLVARNTLMYFTAEAQASIIRRFHFALADPGFLFLGKAEMLLNHGDQFEPVDLRKRLFRKIDTGGPADPPRPGRGQLHQGLGAPSAELEAAALAAGPIAHLVVDGSGRLAAANILAETLFNIRPRNVGQPFQDLEVSYRPVELRSVIEHVTQDQRPVDLTDVVWHRIPGAEPSIYDVSVVPLFRATLELIGVGISFLDVTRYRSLRDELERANRELERAYEELQSLNEELETTNEELQSTNEELETMNEELQSTNDELQAINDILRLRSAELDAVNTFLATVLRSLGSAVIVVDTDLTVKVWSPGGEELWGLRADEAEGKPLPSLDIGLPVTSLVPHLRGMLAGTSHGDAAVIKAVNRRGRPLEMQMDCTLLRDEDGSAQGVILVMNDANAERTAAV